jgi:competence protein ComEC
MSPSFLLIQITIAFTGGVALAHFCAANWQWVGSSAWLISACGFSVTLYLSRCWRRVGSHLQRTTLLLIVVCLGGWATDLQYEQWLLGAQWLRQAQEVDVWGVLRHTAGRIVILPQRICLTNDHGVCFEGKLLLGLTWFQSSSSEAHVPEAPGHVWVRGQYDMPERARNPGAFDPLQDALSNHSYGRLWVSAWESRPGSISFLDQLRFWWQSLIKQALPDDSGALVTGIVLGSTSQLDERDRLAIQHAGISHVTSVSGLHVSIIAGFLWYVLRDRTGARAWLGVVGVGVFVLLVGAGASTVRAFLALLLVVLGRALGRTHNPWLSLAFAWLMLLLVNPARWASIGFRLSFASTAGILALAKPLLQNGNKGLTLSARCIRYIQNMVVLSLGAQLGSAYLTIQTFNTWPVWGLVTNLLGVPLTFLILVSALSASLVCAAAQVITRFFPYFTLLHTLLLWLGEALFTGVGWCASALLLLCRTIASLPWVVLEIPSMPLLIGFSYYAGLIALAIYLQGRKLPYVLRRLASGHAWRWALAAGLLLVLAVFCSLPEVWQLKITFLDVGEGDAILIEVPGGTAVLVDAGPRSLNWDASKTIIPQLRRRGIRRIHMVVSTHPHADHLGGMAGVILSRPVLTALDSGATASSQTYNNYVQALEQQQVTVMQAVAGERITLGNVRFEVLWPPAAPYTNISISNVNDQSVILRIIYGQVAVLLMGDASHRVQEILLQDGELESVALWKTPHQGALDSLEPGFVKRIAPSVSVISVGANSYGHPHADVISALQEYGTVCRTDTDGAIEFVTDGRRWRVRSALGKRCLAVSE